MQKNISHLQEFSYNRSGVAVARNIQKPLDKAVFRLYNNLACINVYVVCYAQRSKKIAGGETNANI